MVRLLLEKGANVKAEGTSGPTASPMAAGSGLEEMVEKLIKGNLWAFSEHVKRLFSKWVTTGTSNKLYFLPPFYSPKH